MSELENLLKRYCKIELAKKLVSTAQEANCEFDTDNLLKYETSWEEFYVTIMSNNIFKMYCEKHPIVEEETKKLINIPNEQAN